MVLYQPHHIFISLQRITKKTNTYTYSTSGGDFLLVPRVFVDFTIRWCIGEQLPLLRKVRYPLFSSLGVTTQINFIFLSQNFLVSSDEKNKIMC